jgi:uncharacterized protein (DUF2235 family)
MESAARIGSCLRHQRSIVADDGVLDLFEVFRALISAPGGLHMAKNIVVYSDGTGQDGGVRPEQRVSNVYKLYRATRVHPDNAIDPAEQVCFYDPGLGTDIGATAITKPVRTMQKLLASVTGRGITQNIAECYEFLINHHEDGDRIWLIGFSRGAYTVRSLANLLMLCGIPTKTPDGPLLRYRKRIRDIADEAVTTVLEHGAGHPRGKYEAERFEMARRFRESYGSAKPDSTEDANVAAHFVGVFDTVAALGTKGLRRIWVQFLLLLMFTVGAAIPMFVLGAAATGILKIFTGLAFWKTSLLITAALVIVGNAIFWRRQKLTYRKTIRDFPNKGDFSWHDAEWKSENFDRLLSKQVKYARSANAIDETRADFDRVAWGSQGQEHILAQCWFAGNHSDIGGSYPETESRLSDVALQWMIEQAVEIPDGLKIGPVTSNGIKLPGTGNAGTPLHLYPSAAGVQHCEIAGMSDVIGVYSRKLPGFLRGWLAGLNYKTKIRKVLPDARLHSTVMERFKMPEAPQGAKVGPYRPEALKNHNDCKQYYPDENKPDSTLAGHA